ncbi:hypothetical protein ACT7CV_20175 [Bacillus paranthracis]
MIKEVVLLNELTAKKYIKIIRRYEMKLYCEKVNFNNKLKTYDIILDFNSMADLEKVAQLLEVQISRESSKTLLHFQKNEI